MTLESIQVEPTRVAYLVKRYPRFSETFIVNEILAHEEAGLSLDIFALKYPNDMHFQDSIARVQAPVHVLPHKGLKAATLWREMSLNRALFPNLPSSLAAAWDEDVVHAYQALVLARILHDTGIGHLHAHFGTTPATVAKLAARVAGISYSFTAHAKDLYHESVDIASFAHRHRESGTIVTVSDFNRNHLVNVCGLPSRQVVRIYNGLDLEQFRYEAPRSRPRRIIAIGRLIEKKGFRDLIEACAMLRETQTDFECRIIGTGPLEQPLRDQLTALGLNSVVRLVGPLPQEAIRRELSSSAVFAAPCVVASDGDRDGIPTTLLEAMALGVPCVSTDVTGIPEVVVGEKTGLVVPQRDPKALADALGRLLDKGDDGMTFSIEGRKLIEEKFDIRTNAKQLRRVFARACPKRSEIDITAEAGS